MDRESLRRFFDEFRPDAKGKVSRAEIFATFHARTGANLANTNSSGAFPTVVEDSSFVEKRRSTRGMSRAAVPQSASISSLGGDETTNTELVYAQAAGASGTIAGCKKVYTSQEVPADGLIGFEDFRASVEEATDPRARNHEALFVELVEDANGSQVEARTPPAMERNLFLSALANGKLAVSVNILPMEHKLHHFQSCGYQLKA